MLGSLLLALAVLTVAGNIEWQPPVWTARDAEAMFARWCDTDARVLLDCPSSEVAP